MRQAMLHSQATFAMIPSLSPSRRYACPAAALSLARYASTRSHPCGVLSGGGSKRFSRQSSTSTVVPEGRNDPYVATEAMETASSSSSPPRASASALRVESRRLRSEARFSNLLGADGQLRRQHVRKTKLTLPPPSPRRRAGPGETRCRATGPSPSPPEPLDHVDAAVSASRDGRDPSLRSGT